jgi:hypothetical protein
MNRARLRLAVLLTICGILTAVAASLYLGMTFALLTEGPAALLDGLRLGIWVVWFGLVVATLPAILFGGLLWLRGVRRALLWAAMGVLGAVVCLGVAFIGPGDIGHITSLVLARYPLIFSLAFAVSGALSALTFLALMRLSTRIIRGRSSIRPA